MPLSLRCIPPIALGLLLTGCSDSTGASGDTPVIASMKADLTALLTAQDAFYVGNADYAGTITSGPTSGGVGGTGHVHFAVSGQNVLVLTYIDANGWSSEMINPLAVGTPSQCGLYVGVPANSPNAAVTQGRTVACW